MFFKIEELKSAIYAYQMHEITEGDDSIVEMGIEEAEEEMKSYLNPSNQKQWQDGRPRYDVEAIFSATGRNRNPLILGMCKDIACFCICRLANVDIIHEQLQARYDRAVDWLEKVSGTGKHKGAPTLTPNLPTLPPISATGSDSDVQPFRYGSRQKFNHE